MHFISFGKDIKENFQFSLIQVFKYVLMAAPAKADASTSVTMYAKAHPKFFRVEKNNC